MGSEMDTFTARLASFEVVLKPEKRRSSGVKGPRFVAWPHSKPSPAELAHAGFFYKPYESNPDNTTCFECGRALDGWEAEDNPVTEHLKHSPGCGWAITMDIHQSSSNPSSIEDPTSDRISQARLATFGSAWPHDGKRGWICQSEKMVEAGWYFCPTEEETDLASCAYCKLSLDGWEPKDDPYEEHYRRSPHCSFFVYAQPSTKKGKTTKGKKSRVSKASSRLSTQSVDTVASEVPDIDIDESMDQSISSQATSKPKGAKRGPKGKGKSAKSKKEEVEMEDQMDIENVEPEQPEPPKAKRGRKKKVVEEAKQEEPEDVEMDNQVEIDTAKIEEPEAPKSKRGRKKRVSEEITQDEPELVSSERHERESIQPPTKRRNTQTRDSGLSQSYDHEVQDAPSEDELPQEEKPKRGRKAKKATSKNRKISDVSVSSKSTSKARIPRDSELDATIKAGLEEDKPEQVELEPEPESEPEPEPARVSKKSKTVKKSKTAAKLTEQPPQEPEYPPVESEDEQLQAAHEPAVDVMEASEEPAEEPAPKAKAAKSSKKKATKKTKKTEKEESKSTTKHENGEENQESFMSVEGTDQEIEPMHESEPEPESQLQEPENDSPEKPVTKKSLKKADKAKKPKKSKKVPSPSPEPVQEELVVEDPIEDVVMEDELARQHNEPMSPSVDEEYGTPDDLPDQVEMVAPQESSPTPRHSTERTPVPPKTAKRFSDIPAEEHLTESITKSHSSRGSDLQRTSRSSNRPVSPLPPPHQSTPSMSPQSSDAENRPPSSRPSISRPAIASVPKEPQARTPLAAATPSPSKRNFNGGFEASSHPWTPVDIDEALFGEPSDKENADLSGLFNGMKRGLTSPEKKMSVQEWIIWNAKNGEERLKRECERLVSQFEKEGGRAMQRLEAIECIE
ncbi:hypothetical protein N7478_001215 [Penicillium angulare]|uniref:uncharacterized protein n=1 Tax=Penicillium angulare TaxID=116970 RepID=UPI00253F69C6|nr:uncharacterized protein N7478_001215 [Penicillium angulare]KAJ5291964.1 hypothetical protein N7478_001215 [Penicillium angulare]